MRINVYLSSRGLCSRREADRFVKEGRVMINGIVAQLGSLVENGDEVTLNGQPVEEKTTDDVYILLNKPKGIVSTTEEDKPGNIISFLDYPRRVFPVGRLDKDSSGLIILTTDGQIVNKILRSENHHDKEYIVKTRHHFPDDFLNRMANGVSIYNPVRHRIEVTKKCQVERLDQNRFSIVLTQGLNRQIRRMAKALGEEVVELDRVRIMNLRKKGLAPGAWRYIEGEELDTLMKMVMEKPVKPA